MVNVANVFDIVTATSQEKRLNIVMNDKASLGQCL